MKYVFEFVSYKDEYENNDIIVTSFVNTLVVDDLNDEELFYHTQGTLNRFYWETCSDVSEFINEIPLGSNCIAKFKSREILDGCNIVVSPETHLLYRTLQRGEQIFVNKL